ncbi:MAG: heavy-metal-associated domain-containing protein [Ignavibacteria bacterium]|nr:heavy-metal-associated domain-containing protein [Ignavibacteria bacterium]
MRYAFVGFIITLVFVGCQKNNDLEVTTINAGTMVCGSCAKTIQKAVYQVEGVKEVNVDLKAKLVEVKYIPLQTNLETIEMAIADAGYDANSRKRNPDAYEKLDACCKIEK